MKTDLKISDYFDKSILQSIQDSICDMAGISVVITGPDGEPVVPGAYYCRFCNQFNVGSPIGKTLCAYSIKSAGEKTEIEGRICEHTCHAGLTIFSAPIKVGGEIIGAVTGGQVLTKEPDIVKIRAHAARIGADPDEYMKALDEVKMVREDEIARLMEFLYKTAELLSEMAEGKEFAENAKDELEHARQMKSDFLANMSHEIRTPMNAVIGLAEMALREDISDDARRYISQIKSSGRLLLTIIGDILDFSKIESGRMQIKNAEYDPVSLFTDVAGIIMTKLIDRDIELILNLNVDMPRLLYGDSARIRQVLTNLANNAVKFTVTGQIRFIVDFSWTSDDEIMLSVSVEDTGIGIKQEQLNSIFDSFSQADQSRSRNAEGAGLGLAISTELLEMMGGRLHAESEYRKGSVFSFKIPQKVVDPTPSMGVNDPESALIVGMFDNEYLADGLAWDAAKLGVSVMNLASDADMIMACDTAMARNTGRDLFVFLDEKYLDEEKDEYFRKHPEICVTVVSDFFSNIRSDLPNLLIAKKPLSAMSMTMILNNRIARFITDNDEAEKVPFTMPDVNILIVEDNAVNMTVTKGLLEPLEMNVKTAMSGREAIRKIEEEHFDIILMDHMMPEMDGVETTRIIRKMYPDYDDVPIIALTANAVEGIEDMFLSEGMNDFVPKPIDYKQLAHKIRDHVPAEKVIEK